MKDKERWVREYHYIDNVVALLTRCYYDVCHIYDDADIADEYEIHDNDATLPEAPPARDAHARRLSLHYRGLRHVVHCRVIHADLLSPGTSDEEFKDVTRRAVYARRVTVR